MRHELNELYKQVILDHNKNPRNWGELQGATCSAEGHNPLCGDEIDLKMVIEGDTIKEIKFIGAGCAISKASASIMTTLLKGKNISEAKELFDRFHDLVTSDPESEIDMVDLGKLAVFCGVREFPARVKCASLAWHTMKNALDDEYKHHQHSQVLVTD
jgi:nitrogen fixation NifU-like protein